ncbi:hypothetical protein [Streptomyces sp. RP5T]|uniref:hypothetical protein n=1 Tax=Streptomyces sp. RP5T TaxID=2490848 RepID=UPI000F6549CA|nr:hypothetical protein [Streptomyces sp. RP5T]RRR85225.1 hypothetical protein EHS43_08950 [Streptomyces sp. RP5T]
MGQAVPHLAVSPSGGLVVGDAHVDHAGRVVALNLVQDRAIGALAFSPEGTRLAVGDQTGRVALWD